MLRFKHPLYDMDAGYKRLSPVYLADYVDATAGTGIVHSAPATVLTTLSRARSTA